MNSSSWFFSACCCFILQRSTEQMRKVPTIVLSITYKGVKFIDAANKVSTRTFDLYIQRIPSHVTHQMSYIISVLWSDQAESSLITCVLLLAQNIIAEHEIRNISCAAQDPEDLCTFAYITKDLQTSHHYCHVFSTVDVVRTTSEVQLLSSEGFLFFLLMGKCLFFFFS